MTVAFTVIGGFLGAGKTTVVNHVLREVAGRRIAVLVNDFGALNIDESLIAGRDGDTIALANGCVCCSIAGGLIEALPPLLLRDPPFDHVIVEASGVADPRKVAQYGTLPGFRLDGVIVAADAETIRALEADCRIGAQVRTQLLGADVVVLTKCDLVGTAALTELHEWLAEFVPGVPVLETVEGNIPLDVVLGPIDVGARQMGGPSGDAASGSHTGLYESAVFRSDALLERAAVDAFLAKLPDGLLRAKGLLMLASVPASMTVLHAVGRRSRLSDGGPWTSEDRTNRIVVIGLAGSLPAVRSAATELGFVEWPGTEESLA